MFPISGRNQNKEAEKYKEEKKKGKLDISGLGEMFEMTEFSEEESHSHNTSDENFLLRAKKK